MWLRFSGSSVTHSATLTAGRYVTYCGLEFRQDEARTDERPLVYCWRCSKGVGPGEQAPLFEPRAPEL